MNKRELSSELRRIADSCDDSRPQQAIKSVLYGLLGAMAGCQEEILTGYTCEFSRKMIADIERQRFIAKASRN